jgi:P pilus assembly chaperone PapD
VSVRTRIISCVLAIPPLGMAQPSQAQLQAQVVPVKYNVTARPGQPVARDVMVANGGDQPVVVRVRFSDWTLGEHGEIALAPAGSTPHSLAGNVQFEPTQFSLAPGESGRIHVTMTLPQDGPATRWGVLLSEVRAAYPHASGFGPRANAELGTTLYLSRVPANPVRAEFTNLAVAPLGDDSISVSVRVRNAGERHFYVAGEVAFADTNQVRLDGGSFGTGVVLPGSEREFTWMCESRLPPGRYLASATLDTGEPELMVGETWFDWRPAPGALPTFAKSDDSVRPAPH